MTSALRFDDVLAGRLVTRQEPALRQRVLEHLDDMARGAASRSLLGTLVAERRLTMDVARGVQDGVDRYRTGRGLGIFAELLARAGAAPEVVREEGRRLGAGADLERLGAAAVAAGLVQLELEERLRFQARVTLERDLAAEVARYVDARRAVGALASGAAPVGAPSGAPSGADDGLAPAGSVLLRTDVPVPSPQEARSIVDKNLTTTVRGLRGPRFRIPGWVDTGDPAVGRLVAGRYRVIGRVGAGGNGVVHLAFREDAPERPWALKLLPKGARPQEVGRFRREALANSLFAHPGALEVDGAGQTPEGEHYLAMEFFDGHDLAHVLEERGRLPARRALRIARQVLEVLEAAHAQGVIHRDVKPENILVSDDLERTRLMDFGIALLRSLGEFDDRVFHTVGPDVVGTPRYMSPEQAASEALTPTSDLYSLGLVLYEALSGAFPFEAETPLGFLACHITEDPAPLTRACPEAAAWPPSLLRLVDALLQKDPDDRPPSAREAIEAIDRALVELPPEPVG